MIIFLALEFGAAAAAFTIRCRYCAPATAGFNRNVEKRRDETFARRLQPGRSRQGCRGELIVPVPAITVHLSGGPFRRSPGNHRVAG